MALSEMATTPAEIMTVKMPTCLNFFIVFQFMVEVPFVFDLPVVPVRVPSGPVPKERPRGVAFVMYYRGHARSIESVPARDLLSLASCLFARPAARCPSESRWSRLNSRCPHQKLPATQSRWLYLHQAHCRQRQPSPSLLRYFRQKFRSQKHQPTGLRIRYKSLP